jgi:hypothetical protein
MSTPRKRRFNEGKGRPAFLNTGGASRQRGSINPEGGWREVGQVCNLSISETGCKPVLQQEPVSTTKDTKNTKIDVSSCPWCPSWLANRRGRENGCRIEPDRRPRGAVVLAAKTGKNRKLPQEEKVTVTKCDEDGYVGQKRCMPRTARYVPGTTDATNG